MEAPEIAHGDSGASMAKALSAEAMEFQPSSTPKAKQSGSPVKPVRTRDVFETLDFVPFTPSQGICTPSPSNVAAMWRARSGHSDMTSEGSSLSSLSSSEFAAAAYLVPAVYPMYSMPYSPGAAHPRYAGPHTPTHAAWSPAAAAAAAPAFFHAAAAGSPGAAAYVGSPAAAALTPGRAIFAQYLVQEGYNSDRSNSPPGGSEGSSPGKGADKRTNFPGAREAAAFWCAQRGYHSDPPTAVLEFASLSLTYGITMDAAVELVTSAAQTGSASSSPDKSRVVPNLQGDGIVRLNSRQRRTLRRAMDRAVSALSGNGGAFPSEKKNADAMMENITAVAQGGNMYKTPMKTNTTSLTKDSYVSPGPNAAGIMPVAFGSPAPMLWQNNMPHVPVPVAFHADNTISGLSHVVSQVSVAQHHLHMGPAAAGGYHVAAMPVSPHAGHAMPMYHPHQQQTMPQHNAMRTNRLSRFAPSRAAA